MSEKEKTALIIGKFCGLTAGMAFLLMPQAGCGQMVINGWDIVANYHQDFFMALLALTALCSSLGCLASKRVSDLMGYGVLGLAAIVITLFKLKGTSQGWESQMVEIKPGAFITVIGFIGSIFAGWWGSQKEQKG